MLKESFLITLALLAGCASAESGHKEPNDIDPDLAALHVDEDGPVLKAYPMSARNNESAQLQKAAALLDYQVASADCLRAQNFYEARSKSSEGARLGVGIVGGVAGFVGSMLAAAGTGGVWPGVSAGIAGVASTTLGAAEKGPLAPSAYAANREFVAKAMAVSSAKLPTLSSAEEIYFSAVSLQGTCAAPIKSGTQIEALPRPRGETFLTCAMAPPHMPRGAPHPRGFFFTRSLMALNKKRRLFVEEYLVDLNATQAAIRAKYSPRRAAEIGYELLRIPEVAEAIAQAMAERSKRTEIESDYVVRRLREIDEMDVLDIHEDDGSFKPIREWPKVWRQFLSGIEVAELFEGRGDDRRIAGVLRKVKWPDKLRNLELLSRHVGTESAALDIELKRLEVAKKRAELKLLENPEDDAPPTSVAVTIIDARVRDADA